MVKSPPCPQSTLSGWLLPPVPSPAAPTSSAYPSSLPSLPSTRPALSPLSQSLNTSALLSDDDSPPLQKRKRKGSIVSASDDDADEKETPTPPPISSERKRKHLDLDAPKQKRTHHTAEEWQRMYDEYKAIDSSLRPSKKAFAKEKGIATVGTLQDRFRAISSAQHIAAEEPVSPTKVHLGDLFWHNACADYNSRDPKPTHRAFAKEKGVKRKTFRQRLSKWSPTAAPPPAPSPKSPYVRTAAQKKRVARWQYLREKEKRRVLKEEHERIKEECAQEGKEMPETRYAQARAAGNKWQADFVRQRDAAEAEDAAAGGQMRVDRLKEEHERRKGYYQSYLDEREVILLERSARYDDVDGLCWLCYDAAVETGSSAFTHTRTATQHSTQQR